MGKEVRRSNNNNNRYACASSASVFGASVSGEVNLRGGKNGFFYSKPIALGSPLARIMFLSGPFSSLLQPEIHGWFGRLRQNMIVYLTRPPPSCCFFFPGHWEGCLDPFKLPWHFWL